MTSYLYRRGDGNEGNFTRAIVELKAGQSPYAALRALVVNDYIAGKSVRRHIIRTIEVDGEAEFGVYATVYEGPRGETAFGSAYITAELQPLSAEDLSYYEAQGQYVVTLLDGLDTGAKRIFREHSKGQLKP